MRQLLVAIFVCWFCCLAQAEGPEAKYSFIDLQPPANQALLESLSERLPDSTLVDLMQGEQKLGSATYKIGPKCISLGSNQTKTRPYKIEIPAKHKLTKLFILHGTQFGAYGDETHPYFVKDGATIGQYMVHYADGSGEGIPIVYGEDVRDWWNWDKSKTTSKGKLVWTGSSPASRMNDVELRLYESVWTNPKPDLEITGITYTSGQETAGAPFCLALTALEGP